jgi:hypothetical protein
VTVYDLSVLGAPSVQLITTGVEGPQVISIDQHGTLYVGNNNTDSISVYPFGTTTPSTTLTLGTGDPNGIATAPNGDLYVTCRGTPATIDIFQPGATSPSQTITDPLISVPTQALFDRSGNFFFADNLTGVNEIPVGTLQPISLGLTGLDGASGLALDARLNRLYVSSVSTANTYVSAFKLGQPTPLYSMYTVDPDNLAYGGPRFEYLFVPDFFGYEIDVYRPDGTSPIAKLSSTFNSQAIAFKPSRVP